ncbi:MAG: fibronectin type III domain-containing protein, partial [Treponema sp.]|nr:fibronectin type III domain-containing protein [Treponema sp.]
MFFTRNSREKIGGGVKRKPLALAPLAALALGALLAACPQPAGDTGAAPPDTGAEAPFTAVTGITGVPTGGVKGFALDLSKAAAAPANATNKTIVWTLKAEGRTAMARGVEGAKYTPEQAGRATLTASVKDGAAPGRDYTKDFELAITEQHIPVTDITGVPENGRAGTALDLSGVRVVPEDATNKTIVWSVAPASAVNADIDGAFITPGSGGALTLWAEISQGKSGGEPYARAFSVAVSPRPPAAPGAPVLAAGDRQISVTWAGVETAAAYEVWYGTASDSASAAQSGGDVSGTAAEITGLTNGKVYHVWIKAKNAGGASGFSPSAWAAPLEAGCVPIGSAEDLAKIGTEGFPMDGAYTLLRDIELKEWKPLGAVSKPFAGTFNGNGRTVTITSFSAEAMSRNVYLGIFAYVKGGSAAAKAVIKDLTINSQIDSIGTNA